MKWLSLLAILVLIAVLTGCASGSTSSVPIEVRDAWVRAATAMGMEGSQAMGTPEMGGMEGMGANSAAYMILHNNTSSSDKLVRVESDVAEAVELHVSEMQGEIMTMRPIDYVEVPAKGEAELKPGGMHIMLIGIKRDLKAGKMVPLMLVFENAGEISIQAEVRAP